jgi:hypothetical protein
MEPAQRNKHTCGLRLASIARLAKRPVQLLVGRQSRDRFNERRPAPTNAEPDALDMVRRQRVDIVLVSLAFLQQRSDLLFVTTV